MTKHPDDCDYNPRRPYQVPCRAFSHDHCSQLFTQYNTLDVVSTLNATLCVLKTPIPHRKHRSVKIPQNYLQESTFKLIHLFLYFDQKQFDHSVYCEFSKLKTYKRIQTFLNTQYMIHQPKMKIEKLIVVQIQQNPGFFSFHSSA